MSVAGHLALAGNSWLFAIVLQSPPVGLLAQDNPLGQGVVSPHPGLSVGLGRHHAGDGAGELGADSSLGIAEGPATAESAPSSSATGGEPDRGGSPPYYSDRDVDALRSRYRIAPIDAKQPKTIKAKRVLRCLVADPICAFNVEINATSAYAYRARQGDVSGGNQTYGWNSGRAQYDLWVNFGVGNQVIGRHRYTTVTFGPKGGVIASDTSDLWGNVGFAMRAWLGRGSWAPSIELSSALTFRIRGERAGEVRPSRSPPGVTADVGVGVGGWGAIVFGGQFDPPLAQEDVPEQVRISSSGMFFVGFRGNIIWGLPAAAAVGTHAAVSRGVQSP